MESGSIVLTPMPQADGQQKNRPALVLCATRPFGDLMICGISIQLRLEVAGFDEVIAPGDEDFRSSGLAAKSLIRIAYVSTLPAAEIKGHIGTVGSQRLIRALSRLGDYLSGTAREAAASR